VEADAAQVFRRLVEEHRDALSSAMRVLSRMRDNARVRDVDGLSQLERCFSLIKASSSYLGLPTLREIALEAERVVDRLQWPSTKPSPEALDLLVETLRYAATELALGKATPRTLEQRERAVGLLAQLRQCAPAPASLLPEQMSDEQLFAADSQRHLEQCREAIVQAADDGALRSEAIHTAFRAMHTLKGNAGMMGFAELEALGRASEWALEGLRSGELALTSNLTVALLDLLEKAALAIARPRAFHWQREAEALEVACTEARYIAHRTRIGALLVEHSFVSREQVELVLAIKREPLGRALILLNELDEEQLTHALDIQRKLRGGEEPVVPPPTPAHTPRAAVQVERSKLKELELRVLALSRLLSDAPEAVRRAARELEAAVTAFESTPVRAAFQRSAALMRELAAKQHKRLSISLHGEELELPRSALTALSDALVHLGRNAVDHGIEHEIERVAAAKDAIARISLSARAEADALCIELIDDGRGMHRERLLRKGIELGLLELAKAHTLHDDEVYALVFTPGFSTCESQSDVSGRGVGMDVVKHAVEALGGTVSIKSSSGAGTRVSLRLPRA
jgi:chemotaxis protein histidine kinase CheA